MRSTLALLFSASLALAVPTAGPVCAVCPITVNSTSVSTAGTGTASKTTYWLVNKSNSGPETPTYCGYNTDETHTWPQVMCYFAPTGKFYSAPGGFTGCPAKVATAPCSSA